MISNRVDTGVKVEQYSHEIEMVDESRKEYFSLVGSTLGGNNPNPSTKDFTDAIKLCHRLCLNEIVSVCLHYYRNNQSMLLVAKDISSQQEMLQQLLSVGVGSNEIVVL